MHYCDVVWWAGLLFERIVWNSEEATAVQLPTVLLCGGNDNIKEQIWKAHFYKTVRWSIL